MAYYNRTNFYFLLTLQADLIKINIMITRTTKTDNFNKNLNYLLEAITSYSSEDSRFFTSVTAIDI